LTNSELVAYKMLMNGAFNTGDERKILRSKKPMAVKFSTIDLIIIIIIIIIYF